MEAKLQLQASNDDCTVTFSPGNITFPCHQPPGTSITKQGLTVVYGDMFIDEDGREKQLQVVTYEVDTGRLM